MAEEAERAGRALYARCVAEGRPARCATCRYDCVQKAFHPRVAACGACLKIGHFGCLIISPRGVLCKPCFRKGRHTRAGIYGKSESTLQ